MKLRSLDEASFSPLFIFLSSKLQLNKEILELLKFNVKPSKLRYNLTKIFARSLFNTKTLIVCANSTIIFPIICMNPVLISRIFLFYFFLSFLSEKVKAEEPLKGVIHQGFLWSQPNDKP